MIWIIREWFSPATTLIYGYSLSLPETISPLWLEASDDLSAGTTIYVESIGSGESIIVATEREKQIFSLLEQHGALGKRERKRARRQIGARRADIFLSRRRPKSQWIPESGSSILLLAYPFCFVSYDVINQPLKRALTISQKATENGGIDFSPSPFFTF